MKIDVFCFYVRFHFDRMKNEHAESRLFKPHARSVSTCAPHSSCKLQKWKKELDMGIFVHHFIQSHTKLRREHIKCARTRVLTSDAVVQFSLGFQTEKTQEQKRKRTASSATMLQITFHTHSPFTWISFLRSTFFQWSRFIYLFIFFLFIPNTVTILTYFMYAVFIVIFLVVVVDDEWLSVASTIFHRK